MARADQVGSQKKRWPISCYFQWTSVSRPGASALISLESRGSRELSNSAKESFRLVTHYGVIEGEGLFFT